MRASLLGQSTPLRPLSAAPVSDEPCYSILLLRTTASAFLLIPTQNPNNKLTPNLWGHIYIPSPPPHFLCEVLRGFSGYHTALTLIPIQGCSRNPLILCKAYKTFPQILFCKYTYFLQTMLISLRFFATDTASCPCSKTERCPKGLMGHRSYHEKQKTAALFCQTKGFQSLVENNVSRNVVLCN